MEKIFKALTFILTVFLCTVLFSGLAFCIENEAPQPERTTAAPDNSVPRLILTDYTLSAAYLTPGQTAELSVTVKNFSQTKSIKNLKLSIKETEGEIILPKISNAYVTAIYPGRSYTWTFSLTAAATATVGRHSITLNYEYEDKSYTPYSGEDSLTFEVHQSTKLTYSAFKLPEAVFTESTVTINPRFLNSGKSEVRNLTVDLKITGLNAGGSVFIGSLAPGEEKTAEINLQCESNTLGQISGTAEIKYEDEFGKESKKTVKLKTVLKEKPAQEEKEPESKSKLWLVTLILGIAVGSGTGAGICFGVIDGKRRKEDETRL